MNLSTLELIKAYPVVEVPLESAVYRAFQQLYSNADVRYRGILVENCYCLWLSRLHDNPLWVMDPYSPVDIELPDCFIDVKSTGEEKGSRSFTAKPRQAEFIAPAGKPLYFVLVTIEKWDDKNATITLRAHHVSVLSKERLIHLPPLEGATKFMNEYRGGRHV